MSFPFGKASRQVPCQFLGVRQNIYCCSSQKKSNRFHFKHFLAKISSKLPVFCFPLFVFFQSSRSRNKDYVSTDLKRLDAEPAELLSNRPMDDPLEQRGRCGKGVELVDWLVKWCFLYGGIDLMIQLYGFWSLDISRRNMSCFIACTSFQDAAYKHNGSGHVSFPPVPGLDHHVFAT